MVGPGETPYGWTPYGWTGAPPLTTSSRPPLRGRPLPSLPPYGWTPYVWTGTARGGWTGIGGAGLDSTVPTAESVRTAVDCAVLRSGRKDI